MNNFSSETVKTVGEFHEKALKNIEELAADCFWRCSCGVCTDFESAAAAHMWRMGTGHEMVRITL